MGEVKMLVPYQILLILCLLRQFNRRFLTYSIRQTNSCFTLKLSSLYAERLIRTQTNHFENETEFIAYQEIGIDKYCPPTPLVLSPNRAWVKHELQLVNQRCAIQS